MTPSTKKTVGIVMLVIAAPAALFLIWKTAIDGFYAREAVGLIVGGIITAVLIWLGAMLFRQGDSQLKRDTFAAPERTATRSDASFAAESPALNAGSRPDADPNANVPFGNGQEG